MIWEQERVLPIVMYPKARASGKHVLTLSTEIPPQEMLSVIIKHIEQSIETAVSSQFRTPNIPIRVNLEIYQLPDIRVSQGRETLVFCYAVWVYTQAVSSQLEPLYRDDFLLFDPIYNRQFHWAKHLSISDLHTALFGNHITVVTKDHQVLMGVPMDIAWGYHAKEAPDDWENSS